MLLVGYLKKINGDSKRISIENYDPVTHEGRVYCADGHLLVAKRGNVRQHHFCHKNKKDEQDNRNGLGGENRCGSEGKTSWHIWWQDRLLDKNIEFRINKEFLKIADSVNLLSSNNSNNNNANNTKDVLSIVEFQNSKMSPEEFALREAFYTRSDLLAQWGVPSCKSILTWVFNLTDCDIVIEHVFGDVICFKWIKGSKYMYPAKAIPFWDFGKRDLVEVKGIHKPKIMESKIIGRLISLEDFDKHYFTGALKSHRSEEDRIERNRLNVHRLCEFTVIKDEAKRDKVIEMCHMFYFGKPLKKESRKKKGAPKEKEIKVTKEDIETVLKQ